MGHCPPGVACLRLQTHSGRQRAHEGAHWSINEAEVPPARRPGCGFGRTSDTASRMRLASSRLPEMASTRQRTSASLGCAASTSSVK